MSLNHPNIIKFYNYIIENGNYYLFLEYAKNKDLFKYIRINRKKLTEKNLLNFFK